MYKIKKLISAGLLLVAIFSSIAIVQAQNLPFTFTLVGMVNDTDGITPLDGVLVNVTHLATGNSLNTTTSNGGFYILNLGNMPITPNAGDSLQIKATFGNKVNTTVVQRATKSPQRVDLVLAAKYIPPSPTGLSSTQGNFWINYTWHPGAGNVTDSYNVRVNGIWYNGTTNTYRNDTVGPHGWSNISVYAFNSSGNGILNETPAFGNIRVANNPVTIGNVSSSYTLRAGETLSIYPTSSDLDGDTATFARNFTNGTFYTNNGILQWATTSSDVGTHFWRINVTDGYGSVSSANFAVTVNAVPTYIPPSPAGLSSTQGNFWINYTWLAGAGNVTNSYNVRVNSIWHNGTTNTYRNDTVGPHGWSNISVYAFNSTGTGVLNETPAFANTQVANNPVTIGNISSSYTLNAGETLSIYPTSSDLDGDTATFARNFTDGTFYTNNGTLRWTTASSDVGIHFWQINVTDGYGSVSSANFAVTVNAGVNNFTINLLPGYNLISIPLNESSTVNASSLAAKVGINITEIVKWDSSTQQFVSFVPGIPLNNFNVAGGEGYFVNVNNPTIVKFSGRSWATGGSFGMNLLPNYNLIGLPVNDTSVTNASTLVSKIGNNVTEIVKWDSNTQQFISFVPGVPLNNFNTLGGEGYFVNLNNPTVAVFTGNPWSN